MLFLIFKYPHKIHLSKICIQIRDPIKQWIIHKYGSLYDLINMYKNGRRSLCKLQLNKMDATQLYDIAIISRELNTSEIVDFFPWNPKLSIMARENLDELIMVRYWDNYNDSVKRDILQSIGYKSTKPFLLYKEEPLSSGVALLKGVEYHDEYSRLCHMHKMVFIARHYKISDFTLDNYPSPEYVRLPLRSHYFIGSNVHMLFLWSECFWKNTLRFHLKIFDRVLKNIPMDIDEWKKLWSDDQLIYIELTHSTALIPSSYHPDVYNRWIIKEEWDLINRMIINDTDIDLPLLIQVMKINNKPLTSIFVPHFLRDRNLCSIIGVKEYSEPDLLWYTEDETILSDLHKITRVWEWMDIYAHSQCFDVAAKRLETLLDELESKERNERIEREIREK